MSADDCLCSPSGCVDNCLSWRHSFRESRISLQRHSLVVFSHWPLLGRLWSWYMSQSRSSMSSQVGSRQTSSMVVGSTPRSCLGNGSLWDQWIVQLCSLQSVAVAWRNISWHRYLQWSLLGTRCHCSLRWASVSNCRSASLAEIFLSFAMPAFWLQ